MRRTSERARYVRQYAAERLGADASMQQRVAALHGRYYAALLQGRLPDLFSAGHAAPDASCAVVSPRWGRG